MPRLGTLFAASCLLALLALVTSLPRSASASPEAAPIFSGQYHTGFGMLGFAVDIMIQRCPKDDHVIIAITGAADIVCRVPVTAELQDELNQAVAAGAETVSFKEDVDATPCLTKHLDHLRDWDMWYDVASDTVRARIDYSVFVPTLYPVAHKRGACYTEAESEIKGSDEL